MKAVKCEAFTQKGTRCSKNGKCFSAISQKNLCTQHKNKEDADMLDQAAEKEKEKQTVEDVLQKQLTVEKFDIPTRRLSEVQLSNLKRHLQKQAKASDGPGHIYIYSLANEQGMEYWKVGTTKKDADERLKEWETEHGVRILKKAAVKVNGKHKYIERLIHLYLAYCRMIRMPIKDEKVMLSKWYSLSRRRGAAETIDGMIEDRHYQDLIEKYKTLEAVLEKRAKKHHQEWFCAPIETIMQVVEEVCAKCAPA